MKNRIILFLLTVLCLFATIFEAQAQRRRPPRQTHTTRTSTTDHSANQSIKTPASQNSSDVVIKTRETVGDFRAILIVVQKYNSNVGKNLPNAWAEMTAISQQLKKLGYRDVTLISDEKKGTLLDATRNNILRELNSLVKRTQKDDTLLVVISTHGVSDNGVSRFIMPNGQGVSINEMYDILNGSPTSKKLMIAEACRSSVSNAGFVKGIRNHPKGLTVFHACSEGEQSMTRAGLNEKSPAEEHSVFLHYLLRGLDEADYVIGGNNGTLTVSELYNYLENKVRTDVRTHLNKSQNPETLSYDSSFVVGRRPIINPFLKMRVPMDGQLESSLDQLVESGNQAVQDASKRLGMTFLESWHYMKHTSRMNTRFSNIHAYADAAVADFARSLIQTYWLRKLTEIGEQCFSLSIELRGDRKSYLFRADMNRALGLFASSLEDYNSASEDMNLYVMLGKTVYREPPKELDTLTVRQWKHLDTETDQTVNQPILAETPAAPKQEKPKDDLDARFEKFLEKQIEMMIKMSLPQAEGKRMREASRNQWRQLTLAEKRAKLDEAEQGFLQMERYMDEGTFYQGSAEAGGLTTEMFEKESALGTIADYLTSVAGEKEIALSVPETTEKTNVDLRVCRLVVHELRGRGTQATWIKATVCDLGVEFDVWLKTQDVFWSKDLAEHYWVSVGEHSPIYRNAQTAVLAKVQNIHNTVMTYESISNLLSRIPYVPGLPGIGGYVAQGEGIARQIVQQRIQTRMGESRSLISRDYHRTWQSQALELEMQEFDHQYGDTLQLTGE